MNSRTNNSVHPGRDVPVDVADVVAPLVVAQVEEVGAVAAQQGAVVALQAPVEPADDLPLEAPQDPFGCQAAAVAPIAGGRRATLASRQHDVGRRDRGRMASTTSSGVTSSPSAS